MKFKTKNNEEEAKRRFDAKYKCRHTKNSRHNLFIKLENQSRNRVRNIVNKTNTSCDNTSNISYWTSLINL